MTCIDTHAHLYLEEFSADLPQVIGRARLAGVSHILLPNIDSGTTDRMRKVCADYKGYCYPMIGLHPTSVDASYEKELLNVEEQLSAFNDYIAIGEVGIDLYWDKTYQHEQVLAFDRQLNLSLEYGLPLVIHNREATGPIHQAMLPYKGKSLKGVFHCFTGTLEEAGALMQFEGFMLGINGVVTFKNSSLPLVLSKIPLERIVLETDAPYLAPVPYRGKRNESAYLKNILLKIAEIYGESPQYIADVTTANALKVFGMLK